MREIRDDLQDEALVEEFIDGREVYVGIVGPASNPTILPIIEMDFGNWSPARSHGVRPGGEVRPRRRKAVPGWSSPSDLSDELRARIERAACLAYRALKLRDYARMDFRIAKTGEPYMLEANPNPYLEKTGELAMAAADVGLELRAAHREDPRVRGRPVPPPRPRGSREAGAGGAVLSAVRAERAAPGSPRPRCGR